MQVSRRQFLGAALGAGTASALSGCRCCPCGPAKPGVAVQLYSIRTYIGGDAKKGVAGAGLAQALKDVAAIGYAAVEFAGYYGARAADLRAMLADAGLVPCGTHVPRSAFGPDEIQKTIDFNLAYGNTHLICPGGGMWPPKDWDKGYDEWWKRMVDFYARAADTANRSGCTLGYHNHTREFESDVALKDGTLMWEYFFANTPSNVCMEQDVGWSTAAGQDPTHWYRRFPHRSPTLHAKENGCRTDGHGTRTWAPHFEGVLGQPGRFDDGTTVKGVDWDALFPVADADGVKWHVVECERHAGDLSAITASFAFLRGKGRC